MSLLDELIQEKAEHILESVDYDIFKEDLEDQIIISGIKEILLDLVQELPTPSSTTVSFKSESCDNYLFTSESDNVLDILYDLRNEWYIEETLYIETFSSNVKGVTETIITDVVDSYPIGEEE